jgi:MFS family permease
VTPVAVATPRPGSRGRQVFKNTTFRRLWAIGAASTAMRWLDTVAAGAFVFQLTNSPFDVALTFFFRMIPMFAFGAYIGAASDRLNRRIILILAYGIMSTVYLLLAVAVFTDVIQVWHVFVGALLAGGVWATDFPVRRAMIGEVVPRENLSTAMGLDMATGNFMRIPGPFLGGFLLDAIGMGAVYVFGGVLFLTAAVLGFSLEYSPRAKITAAISPMRNIVEGVRFIRRDTVIMTVLIITVVMNMFAFPYQSMIPVISERTFGVSNTLMGLLISAEGLGATIGALWVASRATPAHYSRIYFWGSVFFLLMVLSFSRVPWYAVAVPILFAGGFGMSGFGTMQSIMIISRTPAYMRGRVLGVLAVTIGTGPLSALAIGLIAEAAGAPAAVMIIALIGLSLLVITGILLPGFLKLRDVTPIDGPVPDPESVRPRSSTVLKSDRQDDEDGGKHDGPQDEPGIQPAKSVHSTPPTEVSVSHSSNTGLGESAAVTDLSTENANGSGGRGDQDTAR